MPSLAGGDDGPVIITNRPALLSHGNLEGRRIVLDVVERGLQATDPYANAKKLIHVHGNRLTIGHQDVSVRDAAGRPLGSTALTLHLSDLGNIYVVGGGKAAQRMAKAMEDVLGDRITDGHICAKKGEVVELTRIGVTLAGHPIPDADSVQGATRIFDIERQAKKGDLVFVAESGGGTALMTLPAPGVTLEDIQEVTRLLYFECGASIMDVNAVRSHLVTLRGRHGRNVGDATLIVFNTAPTPPGLRERSYVRRYRGRPGYSGAIDVLKKHRLWNRVSPSVRMYLEKADPRYGGIRPGELAGRPQYHFRVLGPEDMLEAAAAKARELGVKAAIVASSPDEIEARAFSQTLACMAVEIEVYGRPFPPPCALIAGGELLVATGETTGIGGRNQEFALSAAPMIEGSTQIVVASVDSDGTDGPTDVAGGIVDGDTMTRAQEVGVDVLDELNRHNSFGALTKLDDAILTGARGTNVQDLRVIYIGEA
jgi:glycerate 2-kinase